MIWIVFCRCDWDRDITKAVRLSCFLATSKEADELYLVECIDLSTDVEAWAGSAYLLGGRIGTLGPNIDIRRAVVVLNFLVCWFLSTSTVLGSV